MHKKIKAFTMIEIMIVIIIVGIIALFSIPNYVKAIAKADERNIVSNLMAIRATLEIYLDSEWTLGAWNTLNEVDPGDVGINDNLGTSIFDTRAAYECGTAGLTNGCKATHPAGWTIHFHDEHSGGLLHCDVGACPSCASNPVSSDCET